MKPAHDQMLELEAAVRTAAAVVDAARASGDAQSLAAAITALEGADRNRTNFLRSLNAEPQRNVDFWGNPRR
ncbi:MAG: hypothetical protein ACOY0T_09525 [Myxococcota bacterium]